MNRIKPLIRLSVDDDYVIIIDSQNWMVASIRTYKKGGHIGERYEQLEAYHHNLSGALEYIVRQKAKEGHPDGSVKAYLAWQESTIHSLADRVLRQRKQLSEALELNGVM